MKIFHFHSFKKKRFKKKITGKEKKSRREANFTQNLNTIITSSSEPTVDYASFLSPSPTGDGERNEA